VCSSDLSQMQDRVQDTGEIFGLFLRRLLGGLDHFGVKLNACP